MPVCIVTGSGGLIGSETVRHYARRGYDVVGVENDMRARFFGPEASTSRTSDRLQEELGSAFRPVELDVRDAEGMIKLFAEHAAGLASTRRRSRRTTGRRRTR